MKSLGHRFRLDSSFAGKTHVAGPKTVFFFKKKNKPKQFSQEKKYYQFAKRQNAFQKAVFYKNVFLSLGRRYSKFESFAEKFSSLFFKDARANRFLTNLFGRKFFGQLNT